MFVDLGVWWLGPRPNASKFFNPRSGKAIYKNYRPPDSYFMIVGEMEKERERRESKRHTDR